MLGSLGWEELLVILVILALIFGASRVSDLGGALGRGIREFRAEASKRPEATDADEAVSNSTSTAEAPAAVAAGTPKQAELLASLDELKRQGLLTDAELAQKREAILSRT